ncbi:MAG: squalene synthase HpnC [Phycisphaeraceae bacterium]
MASAILEQLSIYGPRHCRQLSYEQAKAYTRDLVNTQYENFTVVSRLVPKHLRDDFASVYAFCRWADDLGDETGDPAQSQQLLAWWRTELEACYRDEPRHPVFVALQPTIRRHAIPIEPFDHLIQAFEQDQKLHRYETWEQVLDYCTRSADPVGRLVLYLCNYRDTQRQRLSDRTCTALQLVNFWQDVRRDILERDRIYVPSEALSKHGLTHDDLVQHAHGRRLLTAEQHAAYQKVIHELIDRTWPSFAEGRQLWPLVNRRVRLPIQLFTLGGEAVMRRVEQINYDTIDHRPKISKATKMMLMARAVTGRLLSVAGGGR